MLASEIFPIPCALIDDLEEPPRRRRNNEQQKEIAPRTREEGGAAADQHERINSQNVPEPKWKEQIGGAKSR
jgi:hypothetical protein